MGEKARIYTYTIIYVPTEAFKDKTPYVVAVVEEGSERRFTRIEGYKESQDIYVGMEVEYSGTDENGKPLYKFATRRR